MKIVLLSTASRTHLPNYVVPTGVISIAAYLEQHNHEVFVVDAAALREPIDQTIQRVINENPDVIGISALITAYRYTLDLINSLKEKLPETPIVLGGQLTINTEHLLFKHTNLDYIAHGYGEYPMEKILRFLEGKLTLDEIPGISYTIDGKIINNPGREFFRHVNDMPLPAYHLVDMEHYATIHRKIERLERYLEVTGKSIKNHRFINLMGTLGCTDKCTFCVHEQEYVGLKAFSNDYLLTHMELLHNKYDINVFGIGEEMFLTKVSRLKKFNDLLKERLPNVFWTTNTRGNYITKELVEELVTGNCYNVGWGLESGSTKILTLMKKRMTREKNLAAYENLAPTPIRPSGSLMVGNVGEDLHTIKETISFIKQTKMPFIQPFFSTPYPGGRLWDWAVERGFIKDQHEYLLRVSHSDISGKVFCNITPFPDWVLKGFSRLIAYESYKNSAGENKWQGYRKFPEIKKFIYALLGPFFIPMPIMKYILNLYQKLYELRCKLYTTKKDKQCSYELDEEGAMRPDRLIETKRQKFMKPEIFEQIKVEIKENRLQVINSKTTG